MKIFLILLSSVLIVLYSCKTTKQINKESVRTDSIGTLQVNYDREITTNEQVVMDIPVPGSFISALFDIDDTCEQVVETPDVKLTFKKDSKSGKGTVLAEAKAKTVPVNVNRQTTIKEKGAVLQTSEVHKEIARKTKDVEKRGVWLEWWQWVIVILFTALVISAYWFLFKNRR